MVDDERPDARDEQVASWLAVESLDELTRRRLVTNALAASETTATPAPAQASRRTWGWLAAAAVLVVVLVAGLAVLRSSGGDDSEVATRNDRSALAPKTVEATRDVGDFGDLDDPANLGALRTALEQPATGAAAPRAAAGNASGDSSATGSTADAAEALRLCGLTVPDGAIPIAQGTGTIDGRRATVVLVEAPDGTRTLDAVLEDPCETRHLP